MIYATRSLNSSLLIALLLSTSFVCMVGCGIGASREAAPKWNPKRLTAAAFEQADANGDSLLDETELDKAPGVKSSLKYIDTNGDKKISPDELEARIEVYKKSRVALTGLNMQLLYKKRPLGGAKVKLIPEPFLGELVQPAETVSWDDDGTVKIDDVRLGYYRIEVTHDKKKLPAKYNTETTLGIELAPFNDSQETYGIRKLNLK